MSRARLVSKDQSLDFKGQICWSVKTSPRPETINSPWSAKAKTVGIFGKMHPHWFPSTKVGTLWEKEKEKPHILLSNKDQSLGIVGKMRDFQTQRLGYCGKEKLQILLSNKDQSFVTVGKVFYTDFQIQRFWNYGEKHNTILISKKDPGSGTVGRRQSCNL